MSLCDSLCDIGIRRRDKSSFFQILFYIVHPLLLWASNRSFSSWLPIKKYGWPPLFVHSGDMAIPFHSPFSYSTLCYFLPCPCSYLHIAYSIRIFNAQYPTQPSIFACIRLILHSRCQAPGSAPVWIGITAELSSLSFIARLISCLLKTFSHNLLNVTPARAIRLFMSASDPPSLHN